MSDGVSSDAAMWASGERDLSSILSALPVNLLEKKALEVGCGVGRLLRAASKRFEKVIGVDISKVALSKAKTLLSGIENVELLLGCGATLSEFKNRSLDVIFSFAAFSLLPEEVAINYLYEFNRVLKVGGFLSLQLYTGEELAPAPDNSIHFRSYNLNLFTTALERVGFKVVHSKEVEVPFLATPNSSQLLPIIITAVKINEFPDNKIRLFSPNIIEASPGIIPDLENYIVKSFSKESIILEDVNITNTADGPVIAKKGLPLDHATSPRSSGDKWAKGILGSLKDLKERVFVFGFGSGYHIRSLLEHGIKDIVVIEPERDLFSLALTLNENEKLVSRLTAIIHEDNLELINSFYQNGAPFLVRAQYRTLYPDILSEVKTLLYSEELFKNLQPKIAVIGPLHGGTLPIAHYSARALTNLGLRVRLIDTSFFNHSYDEITKFANKPIGKIKLQNKFLELISAAIAENYEERPFDILISMAQAPISYSELDRLRSLGVITVLWFTEDYLRFTYWRDAAKHFDFVFTIQRDKAISAIKNVVSNTHVSYLPVACDPSVHRPLTLSFEEEKRYGSSLSFVGAGYYNRQQTFAALSNYDFKIWGTEWPEGSPFNRLVQDNARRLTPEEYVKIFNASAINLNLHSSTEKDCVDPSGDFINPRVFELAACRAFQLVDKRSLLSEIFNEEELVTFSTLGELRDQIEYFSDNKEARDEYAKASYERVRVKHTYEERFREMLKVIYSVKGEQLLGRKERDAWRHFKGRSDIDGELELRSERAMRRGDEPTLDAFVSDIIVGNGRMTEVESKLMFLYHVRKQTSARPTT
jgi:spore maturation protein CgeB